MQEELVLASCASKWRTFIGSTMRPTCLLAIKSTDTEKTPSSQTQMCPKAPLKLRMPRSRPSLAGATRGTGSYAQRYCYALRVSALKSAQWSEIQSAHGL